MSNFVLKMLVLNRLLIQNTRKKFIKENLSYYHSYSGLDLSYYSKHKTWSSKVSHEMVDVKKV